MEVSNETVIPVDNASEAPEATLEIAQSQAPLSDEVAPAVKAEPAQPAYTPDYTYKVVNEVKEFDPRIKGLIKSKEDEQWARDLVTKAEGLEVNKRNLEMTARERDQLKAAYMPLQKDVTQVLHMIDKKDYPSLFAVLGVDKKDILQWAYEEVTVQELPEHQRKAYNERNELSRKHYTLEQQNQEMREQLQQIQLTQRQTELTNIVNSGDHASIVKEFDQRNGPNAFYNEVVRRGVAHATATGETKSPQDVINEIITVYGLKREAPKATNMSSGQGALPVIPNTGSSGAAPVMKKIKTVEEMKAYAQTLED